MAFNLFSSNKKESEDKNTENTSAVLSSLSNVIIHTMPKRFLHKKTAHPKKAHGLGLVILIVGTFALLAIFVVLYVYLTDASFNQTETTTDPVINNNQASDPVDINIDKKDEPNITNKENKRKDNPANTNNIKKETKNEIATSTKDDINKNNDNKVEVATSTAVATSTDVSVTAWVLANDSDNDGLSDPEETLLGLNKNYNDSDGDTYDDFSEFLNMYNPAGEGKISAHPNISTYYNSSYLYSFYYPLVWTADNVDSDKSIMFKIENNQFVQIIAIDNSSALTLDDWYKKEFDQTIIKTDRRIYKAGWQGLRSNDDLTAYLQKSGKTNIYTISYNLGVESTWSYKNIFELILKSFEVE